MSTVNNPDGLKFYKKPRGGNPSLVDKQFEDYFSKIDIVQEAIDKTGCFEQFEMPPILLGGYDYDKEFGPELFAKEFDGKAVRSTLYTKAVLLFGREKMYIYKFTLSNVTQYTKESSVQVYYRSIESVGVQNETMEFPLYPGKGVDYRFSPLFSVISSKIVFNCGERICLPLNYTGRPFSEQVLNEVMRFIDMKKQPKFVPLGNAR